MWERGEMRSRWEGEELLGGREKNSVLPDHALFPDNHPLWQSRRPLWPAAKVFHSHLVSPSTRHAFDLLWFNLEIDLFRIIADLRGQNQRSSPVVILISTFGGGQSLCPLVVSNYKNNQNHNSHSPIGSFTQGGGIDMPSSLSQHLLLRLTPLVTSWKLPWIFSNLKLSGRESS